MARDRGDRGDEGSPLDEGRRLNLGPKTVVSIVGLVILLVFAFRNTDRVPVDLVVTSRDVRLIYVIIGSAVLGAVIDRFLTWRRRRAADR